MFIWIHFYSTVSFSTKIRPSLHDIPPWFFNENGYFGGKIFEIFSYWNFFSKNVMLKLLISSQFEIKTLFSYHFSGKKIGINNPIANLFFIWWNNIWIIPYPCLQCSKSFHQRKFRKSRFQFEISICLSNV